MDQVQTVVIGAGVVGLAIARALAIAGREVWLLEALDRVGSVTSSRNSEVLHAGLHHPRTALKTTMCVLGRSVWLDFARSRGIAHRVCGKLIVATDETQRPALEAIAARGLDNGAQVRWLDSAQVRVLEPALRAHAAVLSPETAIVDSHGLMQALWADFDAAGGQTVLRTPVDGLRVLSRGLSVHTRAGDVLLAAEVVNAAGLQAWAVARHTLGLDAAHIPPCHYAKGSYFGLQGRAPFRHLIYPLPQPGGLGIHLTLDLAGQARFGPDVQWVSDPDDTLVDPARVPLFEAAIRTYWPDLPSGRLAPAYAGMRPKLTGPGQEGADFMVQGPRTHGVPGLVNLFGIESPGLTSALPLANRVRDVLDGVAV